MSITATEPLGRGGARPSPDQNRTATRAAGAERRVGRRAISVSLLLIGVFALVSGIWSLMLGRGSFVVPVHVATGSFFGLLSVIHIRYNRNALRLYLRDLGWSPAVLRLAIVAAASLVLLLLVMRFG
jgi:hypothetical protein